MLAKLHVAGLLGMGVSVLGWLMSPGVFNALPPKAAAAITVAGIIWQGVTKGVQHGNTTLVENSPKP